MADSVPDDTASLLALAQGGDVAAFSRVMEAEQPRLMAQALGICGQVHLAQDLVQETMIAAWKVCLGSTDRAGCLRGSM